MKRLIRFLALFGLGLLAFALALGPARLFRGGVDTTIAATDVGDARAPIEMKDPGQKRSVGIELHGAGRLPYWKLKLEPDGSTLRVKAALVTYDGIESFPGGFHFTRPRVELYPAKKSDERANARLSGGAADVAMRGASELGALSQGPAMQDVHAFSIANGARLEMLDEIGAVVFTLETERLESPEAPLDESGAPILAAKLIAPGPVHLWRADQSLDLHAGGMELDRVSGKLTLSPPLTVTGSDATLTADGPATFVRRAPATPSKPKPGDGAAKPGESEELRPEQLIGPGDLLFTRNVFVKQGERWLRSDRVAVELGADATGKSEVERLDAGLPERGAAVTLGLLGGEGSAAALHWLREENALRLEGPVELKNLVLGEGAQARRLKLSAAGELVARELPAEGGAAPHATIELKKGAHAEIPGELTAAADRLFATLQQADAKSGAPAKLLSVDLECAADSREPASVDLGARGKARARRLIHLVDDGAGGHVAHLEGDARVDAERGFVTAESIDVVAPADPKLASRITVPALAGGELVLPAGGSLFASPDAGVAVSRKLALEPLGACPMTIEGSVVDLGGRCRYHVRAADAEAAAPDLQTLVANELHLRPREAGGGGELDVTAVGAVEFDDLDPANPVHVVADVARTERSKAGARRLVLEGVPASLAFALPQKVAAGDLRDVVASAAMLVLDLDSGAVVADDERQRVSVTLPESLLAELLPSVRSVVAARKLEPAAPASAVPAQLFADHLEITPGPGATRAESLQNGRLHAWGRAEIVRPSSGGTVRCRELALDLARRSARLDGDKGAPVALEEPKPYDKTRVESMTATWIEVRHGGAEIDVAPGARFVLHPEDEPTAARPIPPMLRVTIQAADAPQLRGRQLLFGGGVETTLERVTGREADQERIETLSARSERAELLFNHGVGEKEAPGLAPIRFNASQRVRLNYQGFHAEGALLSYDFATRWLMLKEGINPCTMLGQDPKVGWHGVSRFRVMRITLQDEALLRPDENRVQIEGLEMTVEGPRGR